jgi:hypothetical protein
MKPRELGEEVADGACMLRGTAERNHVISAVQKIVTEERHQAIKLTKAEASAALDAISQMTDGNARDYSSWREQTCGAYATWQALIRAEQKIRSIT